MPEIPTDPYELLQYNMIRAHQTFKNGYQSILPRLDNPPMDDLTNFLGYCEAWADAIDDHHGAEEIVVFPFLNKKLDFSQEIEAHKIIHAGLDELLATIRAAKADTSLFDAQKLKEMMVKLKEPLFKHLDEEVAHIAPGELKVWEAHELEGLIDTLEKHAKSAGNPFVLVPYMRSHTPPEYKDLWPPMPWIVRKFVVPYVLAVRYSGYWKYSPYAMS
ncbi:hypothetical protein JB92DRAFT_2687030 [Gautieria morchelliformis]|nr:hypothetical protein JB92DRAFT_2687030 [Gautieria morchelliformis]